MGAAVAVKQERLVEVGEALRETEPGRAPAAEEKVFRASTPTRCC